MTRAAEVLIGVLLLTVPRPVFAQQQAHRVDVFGGAGFLGAGGLGSSDANVRANQPTRQPFRLFATDTTLTRATTLPVAAGYTLTSRLAVEGGVTFGRPEIRTSVRNDVENAPAIAIAERI